MMIRGEQEVGDIADVLFRIKRGLAGYVSYLAACEMNQAFSEYVLYEPILRILTARGYDVECEVPCPPEAAIDKGPGDFKRIDFVAKRNGLQLAIEVKWTKKKSLDVKGDYEKLDSYHRCNKGSLSFLCVFGKKSNLEDVKLNGNFSEKGKAVYADFRKTRYGCRIYQLKERTP